MEELERKRLHWQKVRAVVSILLLLVVTASAAGAFFFSSFCTMSTGMGQAYPLASIMLLPSPSSPCWSAQ